MEKTRVVIGGKPQCRACRDTYNALHADEQRKCPEPTVETEVVRTKSIPRPKGRLSVATTRSLVEQLRLLRPGEALKITLDCYHRQDSTIERAATKAGLRVSVLWSRNALWVRILR